ncbi:MAG: hypothetical protein IIA59_12260 [Candidatus Marinimicrobia bacterium]|nr:hypothetical protein [Candidatus Neomarinimicrobiota bacterium]
MPTSKTAEESPATQDMFVSGTFKYVDSRTIDAKARVSLGQELTRRLQAAGPVESFNVFMDDNGHVLLVPMQHIPVSEMWTWTGKDIRESFDRAKADVAQGRTVKVTNLDKFLDEL